MRFTKIVATLGPASSSEEKIKQLINAGVDVFRLNFSHGTHESHRQTIAMIRDVSRDFGVEVGILQDLCGPKIRVGEMQNGCVELESGADVVITTDHVEGTAERFTCEYGHLPQDIRTGQKILLNDGALELKVMAIDNTEIHCRVIQGGPLKNHKGINLPETHVSSAALTEKDIADLHVGLQEEVDFVALSFVRTPKDIEHLRELRNEHNRSTRIIAKIEKPEAIQCINDIIRCADGIMVARGDLGVEMDVAKVPFLQKKIIRQANASDRYVITATQMLESMITNPFPTRAEVTDVATAVIDGTDAVMLSGETAAGDFPVKAVEMMDHIVRVTEEYLKDRPTSWDWTRINPETVIHDAIGNAVLQLWKDMNVKAIATYTTSGGTALFLSKSRPFAPIVVFTPNIKAYRRMRLYWGVLPMMDLSISDNQALNDLVNKVVKDKGLAEPGDSVIVIKSSEIGTVGANNIIEICHVKP